MEADGVFTQFPIGAEGQALQPLQTTVFSPSYDKDRFENTSWTINGRIGLLKAVYTGGYLTRHVDQVQDYTNYARGVYGDYYQCTGGGIGAGTKPVCYSPVSSWQDTVENTHQTHEFRLSTPDDWRAPSAGRRLLGKLRDQRRHEFQLQVGSVLHPGKSRDRACGRGAVRRQRHDGGGLGRPRIRASARTTPRSARTSNAVTNRPRFSSPSTMT